MILSIEAELAAAIAEAARADGTTPEALARAVLQRQFLPNPMPVPRDDWERRLLDAAVRSGVTLPNKTFLGEAIYD